MIALFFRELAGCICVLCIGLIEKCPASVSVFFLQGLLPMYMLIRWSHIQTVRTRILVSPFSGQISIWSYYHRRLSMLIQMIKAHRQKGTSFASRIQGEKYFREAIHSQKPVLLCGLHMGLFELLHRVPFEAGKGIFKDFTLITAPAFSKIVTAYMIKGRLAKGKSVVFNSDLSRAVKKTIRQKGVLAVMLDQYPSPTHKHFYLWGQLRMRYNPKLLDLFEKAGGHIIPVSTWITHSGESVVNYHPALNRKGGDWGAAIRQFIERQVQKAPAQWNWSYPALKIMPEE
ncbi:MAG: hypothetical protein HQK83_13850 [Fibrobacteria bacterium]|nr:hypothetical protein [Fibrobacteria bacterium]